MPAPRRYAGCRGRGGRAVECGGLENRFGGQPPTRVQIPPPPLALRKSTGGGGLSGYDVASVQSTGVPGSRASASRASRCVLWPALQVRSAPSSGGIMPLRHVSRNGATPIVTASAASCPVRKIKGWQHV